MMVREAFIALGEQATRREIAEWIRNRYPGTKPNTVSCQTTICTVNNPVRVQFQQNKQPRSEPNRYDFLFQRDDGSLVSYSPLKHGSWIIVKGANGQPVIKQTAAGNSKGSEEPRLHIFFCGAPSENRDYAYLTKLATNGGTTGWSSLKGARAGDRLLFYTVQERRAFMASGWVHRSARPTNDPKDYPYRTTVGSIRLLTQPVSIKALKRKFPAWGWARYTRNIVTVPRRFEEHVWAFVHRLGAIKPAPQPQEPSLTVGKSGSGFGASESNRIVEEAAINAVKKYLRRQKYCVHSREAEKIGYDLDAVRGGEILHVEVKGISGRDCSFIITQNEVATARIDPFFRLFVVTAARTSQPVITEFQGSQIDSLFSLTALSYRASRK